MTPIRRSRRLDVRERLLVLEVVAGDQAFDLLAADAEGAVVEALDLEPAPGRRAEHAVLGERVLPRQLADVDAATGRTGTRRSSSTAELVEPGARRARRDQHRDVVAEPRRPRRAAASAAAGVTRSAFDSASTRGSAASRGSWARSSASIVAWLATGSEPSSGARSRTWTSSRRALDVGEEVVAEPRPSLAPSISPGMSASTSWRSAALERPEHRLERRERVVGDLRRGARHPRQQRRLAGVGQPHEPDVGQQLEPQVDRAPRPAARARQTAAPGASAIANGGCRARPRRRGRRRRAAPARRGRGSCRRRA